MFYTSVPPLDHGLLEFPTNSYGGFAYRSNTLENPTTSGAKILPVPTKRFVTEHNLALFWRRPGLCPRALALPVPLLSTAEDYAIGTLNRPPGMLRTDCAPIRYHRRNLLAGEYLQSDDSIRLWAVNDSSDHKCLLHYKLRIAAAVDDNIVSSYSDVPNGRRRDRLLCLQPVEHAESGAFVGRIDLASEVLQLKAAEWCGQEEGSGSRVFMRTKNSLELLNTLENSISPIFHSQPFAFTQIPHLDGELAVVDARGMLFWGHIELPSSFARFKCPSSHQDICPTDCPRTFVSIDEQEARLFDLRDGSNCAGQLLFAHSTANPLENGPFSDQFHASLMARDRLCRVNALDITLSTVLVTSTRRHTLIDLRMPGVPLLTMAHCEIDGADHSIVSPPFLDPATGSQVFSLYSLTHTKKPALSQWSLMYHPSECLWSSLGPKFELDTPRHAITQFSHLHAAADVSSPAPRVALSMVPKYTRAIHYQQLGQNLPISSATRALLFRQMEGGEIWYENVFFDPLPKLRQDGPNCGAMGADDDDDECEGSFAMNPINATQMRVQCLEQIAEYQAERTSLGKPIGTHFFKGVQEELMDSKQSKLRQTVDLTVLDIASEIVVCSEDQQQDEAGAGAISPTASSTTSFSSRCSAVYSFGNFHQLISDECVAMDDDAQFYKFDNFDEQESKQDKLFSIHVAKIWQKTLTQWQEGKEERAHRELGLVQECEGKEEAGKQPQQQKKSTAVDDDGSDGDIEGQEEEVDEQEKKWTP